MGMKSYSAKKDIYLLMAETIVLRIKYKKNIMFGQDKYF